jgi:hypothetical protein
MYRVRPIEAAEVANEGLLLEVMARAWLAKEEKLLSSNPPPVHPRSGAGDDRNGCWRLLMRLDYSLHG